MSESSLLKKFLVEYSRIGIRLFRTQSGLFWAGKSEKQNDGSVLIRYPRRVRVGVEGISDLTGFTPVTITPDMVGRTLAVYTACEVKTKNVSVTKEQSAFVRNVNRSGGIGVIAREVQDLLNALDNFNLGDSNEHGH